MKRSLNRILTTHAGALHRPQSLRSPTGATDDVPTPDVLATAVVECVAQQVKCGIDIVNDGELSKPSFTSYLHQRISGLSSRELARGEEHPTWSVVRREEGVFPDYFRLRGGVFVRNGLGGAPTRVPVCNGPLNYIGHQALQVDLDNFKAALQGQAYEDAYIPAPAPGIMAHNSVDEYYGNEEAYLEALAVALREEYTRIVDAGFQLQIDAPNAADDWQRMSTATVEDYRRQLARQIESLNHALRGIPADRVRFHVCWGSWWGPHVTDLPLREFADLLLRVNATYLSIEAANPRHQHEWRVWEDVKLPEDKILIPGVIGHSSDFIEHPQMIAERLMQYAGVVGRENVIGGADCGLVRVSHPQVAWAKLQALSEGARLATRQLWGAAALSREG